MQAAVESLGMEAAVEAATQGRELANKLLRSLLSSGEGSTAQGEGKVVAPGKGDGRSRQRLAGSANWGMARSSGLRSSLGEAGAHAGPRDGGASPAGSVSPWPTWGQHWTKDGAGAPQPQEALLVCGGISVGVSSHSTLRPPIPPHTYLRLQPRPSPSQ